MWPLPAVAVWAFAWAIDAALRSAIGATAAFTLATAFGVASALLIERPWRRGATAAGFPLLTLASGLAAALPAWLWLIPLALLLALYPLRAWRDAPLFPTPRRALDRLASPLALPADARLLDAGCGLGDGLRALQSAWPSARVEGVEWSWLLAALSALRCRHARIHRADMWAWPWGGFDLVYLFQRPESMARAWHKACAEMSPGAWLVSLEFDIPGRAPEVDCPLGGGRSLRAWRVPTQSSSALADNPR